MQSTGAITDGSDSLALDHCAAIVNDLAAGAARWERLGFRLTPESRQRGVVSGATEMQPWATANRCAILADTYLELVGIVDASAFNPWDKLLARGEGLHIAAARCGNADAAHAALTMRTDAFAKPVRRERTVDVDGEPRVMRFRNIFSRDQWPEARYIVIEHQTPEYLWQPRYMQHENGADALVDLTFVTDEPSGLASRLSALSGSAPTVRSEGLTAALPGRGQLHVLRSQAFADAYGYVPANRPGLHAMTVSFGNLAHTLALLERRGVEVRRSGRTHWIAPRETNGFVMQLIETRT